MRFLAFYDRAGRSLAAAAAVSLAVLGSHAAQAETLSPNAVAQIDAAAASFIKGGYGPGVSVAVMRKGQLVFAKGYGFENLETGAPMTPQAVLRAGSITKMFTAAAIVRLAQQGRLSVDDPVAKYVPELAGAGPVTLRMLLTHTSGLHTYTDETFGAEALKPHTTQQMIDYIASKKPLSDFAPGSKWAYSNSNFYVLGAIVERVSGIPLDQFLQKEIIAPAGLAATALDHETDVVPHRASGYVPLPGQTGRYRNGDYISLDPPGGAGALRSTATDLAQWHQALFAGRILSPQSLAQMTAPGKLSNGDEAIRVDAPVALGPPRYGFGLELGTLDGEPTVGHGGAIPGFTAYLVTFPRLQMTVAIMTNGEPNAHEPFHDIDVAALHGGVN